MSSNNTINTPYKQRRRRGPADGFSSAQSGPALDVSADSLTDLSERQTSTLKIEDTSKGTAKTPRKQRDTSTLGEQPLKSDMEQSGQEGNSATSTGKKKKPRSKKPQGSAASPQPIRQTPHSNHRSSPSYGAVSATPPPTAYAGPAFHASPAPSALPMPSFFSKSLPASSPIKDAQGELNESDSDTRPDSPTPGKYQSPAAAPAREESPLDFFFKADREEKSRPSKGEQGSSKKSTPATPKFGYAEREHQSASPLAQRPKNHSRHSTGHSLNGIFPLELEGKGRSRPTTPNTPSQPGSNEKHASYERSRSNLSEVANTAEEEEEAKRRASSQALKDLLFASQRKPTSTAQPNLSSPQNNNNFTENNRHLAGPSDVFLPGPPGQMLHDPTYPPRPRTRSSGLRQEVMADDENNAIARRYIEEQLQQNGRARQGYASIPAFSSLDGSDEAGKTENLQAMEQRLRGMLNLGKR